MNLSEKNREENVCVKEECHCHEHHHDTKEHNHHGEHCCGTKGQAHHGEHHHSCACGCEGEEVEHRKLIAGVAVFLFAVVVFHIPGLFKTVSKETMDMAELVTFLLIYLLTARDIVVGAIKRAFKGAAMDEQFLMTVASLGAFFVGEYSEACAVMLFYLVGEAFEDYAVNKSRASISELMDIRPDYANLIKKGGIIERVSPEIIKPGDMILVKPGEKIPLDGVVREGKSSLDTSALTGESLPKDVKDGEGVLSGSININAPLTIQVEKEFEQSTVSKILNMVQHSGEKKAKTEQFITRFAKVYTPIVVSLAALIAIVPPLVQVFFMHADINDFYGVWNDWIYKAFTFLVISCPCALVISVPLSFFAGIGGASTKGVLIKGGNFLEALAKCDTVVFDKTGTLTQGYFTVHKIKSTVSETEFLKTVAIAEVFSNHPIAKSMKESLEKIDKKAMEEIVSHQNEIKTEELHGKGIKAIYNGHCILSGNEKLMLQENISFEKTDENRSIVYVAKDGEYLGYAVILDELKNEAKTAMEMLKETGVKRIALLSGDRTEIAEYIGEQLGIDEIHAQLLPADKVEHVEEMLQQGSTLAFVGDGVNDAPVLARADIGIAMGAMGSDAAIEAADVVLMDDNPMGIAKAIQIAKNTLRIAKQNIVFALAVKVAVLSLSALGMVTMWAAVFADVGVCVIAIVNAMRCRNGKVYGIK